MATAESRTIMEEDLYPHVPPSTATEVAGEDYSPRSNTAATNASTDKTPCSIPVLDEIEIRRERIIRRLILRCRASMGTSLIWEQCCEEVEQEYKALDALFDLAKLPPYGYSKEKSFPITDYIAAPDFKTCASKDYLDFYIFPYLLPAIYSLLMYTREQRVFQCQVCTFSPLDFIAENLYNYNPWHPERLEHPVPLYQAPFAKRWIEKNPRPALPKWLTMSPDEAAHKIQRFFRGFLVRRRPEVQEMRQFWITYRQEAARCPSEEISEDEDVDGPPPSKPDRGRLRTHSEQCLLCASQKCKSHVRPASTAPPPTTPVDGKPFIDRDGLAMKYEANCFHTEGHLPFSLHKSQIFKLRSASNKPKTCIDRHACTAATDEAAQRSQMIVSGAGEKSCKSVEVLLGQGKSEVHRGLGNRKLSLQDAIFKPSAHLKDLSHNQFSK